MATPNKVSERMILRIPPLRRGPTELTWEEKNTSNYRFDTSVLERLREAIAERRDVLSREGKVGKVWRQERPEWCPHQSCQFVRRVTDAMCCGNLPEPQEHDGDFNIYRLCLNGAADDGGVFDLQINKTDISWFRWLFNAVLTREGT